MQRFKEQYEKKWKKMKKVILKGHMFMFTFKFLKPRLNQLQSGVTSYETSSSVIIQAEWWLTIILSNAFYFYVKLFLWTWQNYPGPHIVLWLLTFSFRQYYVWCPFWYNPLHLPGSETRTKKQCWIVPPSSSYMSKPQKLFIPVTSLLRTQALFVLFTSASLLWLQLHFTENISTTFQADLASLKD